MIFVSFVKTSFFEKQPRLKKIEFLDLEKGIEPFHCQDVRRFVLICTAKS